MAIGKASNFKIYQEQFFGGVVEVLLQRVKAFGAASRNAIRVVPSSLKGDYEYESFFQKISSLISRRDTTSTAVVTDLALTQEEKIGVKLNKKIGPVANTLDSFRKINEDPERLSFILGEQWAPEILASYLNTALNGLDAALSFSGWTVDKTGASTTTMTTAHLVDAMAKMGDGAERIVAWVMHSKPYFDLVKEQIAAKITDVANYVVRDGMPITLGRPVIVTDSSDLLNTLDYTTLGLVANAAVVTESETREIVSEKVTGLENLVYRIQGEYAFNLGVKGFKWDVSNGGANPTDANVGTQSNWDKVAAENKGIAGVRLLTL